jgi:hypothetical protein
MESDVDPEHGHGFWVAGIAQRVYIDRMPADISNKRRSNFFRRRIIPTIETVCQLSVEISIAQQDKA